MMEQPWIAQRLETLGRTRRELARALGVDPARISEILAGRRHVKVREVPALARFLDMDAGVVLLRLNGEAPAAPPPTVTVPVVGAVQAGAWAEAMTWPPEDRYPVVVPPPHGGREPFGLVVRGQSMNLDYPEGTILICVPFLHYARTIGEGDHVVVHRRDRTGLMEATVKALVIDSAGHRWLCPRSSDPAHQTPLPLPATPPDAQDHAGNDDIQVVGVVVAHYRAHPSAP